MYSIWCEIEPGHEQRRDFMAADPDRGFVSVSETHYPMIARASARAISANEQTMCFVREMVSYPELDHQQLELVAIFQNGAELMEVERA